MSARAWTAAAASSLVVLVLAWILGGPGGAVYLILLALACMAGWPLGLALFGRHPVALVAGTTIGYAGTALLIWLDVRLGFGPGVGLFAACTVAAGWILVRALRRRTAPPAGSRSALAGDVPPWGAADSRALIAALLLAAAIVVPPLARVGAERAADGARLYRAYFTADFIWHMALTAELAKGEMPPLNPYLRGERLHYYWTYFLPPAAAARSLPVPTAAALKVTAFFAALTFTASIFALAWIAVPRPRIVLAAVAFGFLAASFEGTYAVYDLWKQGRGLAEVADLNIDAISAWQFGGLRIDGLARAVWYNPQHSMALAIALPALMALAAAGPALAVRGILIAGLFLAGAFTFNPFVAAIVASTYGLVVLVDAARSRRGLPAVVAHALALGPLLAALVWSIANEVADGAGGAVRFGLGGPAARQPVTTLLISLGPLLAAAAPGFMMAWRRQPGSRLMPAAIGSVVAIVAMYGMRLSVDDAWVGFRTGHIVQVLAIVLVAATLSRLQSRRSAAILAAIACAGLPTTAIDYWNARDLSNTNISPGGFRWTVAISRDERAVLDWIRTQTPADAIVQMDALSRQRETWSLIPSFAERRMAAGLPISLLNVPEYRARSERVRAMYAAADASMAWRTARDLGIDYIYADRVERHAHPEAIAKFDAAPELFQAVIRRRDAAVWRVLPR